MTQVILIRHGETDWNTQQVFRGRIDIPLNESGLAQARAVRESLKDREIDRIYSSPLSRALETARILGENRNVNVETEEAFVDIDFGEWQGLANQKVRETHKDLYEMWLNNPHTVTFPEGESLEMVSSRSGKALEKIVKKHSGETIAIVSHRVLNKVLLCAVLGVELSRFWYIRQDTCAINIFEYKDGAFYLTLLNDTCHLKNIEGTSRVDF